MRNWIEKLGKISKELGINKNYTTVKVNNLEWNVYPFTDNTYRLHIKDISDYDNRYENSTYITIYQDEFDYLNDILLAKQKDYQNQIISKIESLEYACN